MTDVEGLYAGEERSTAAGNGLPCVLIVTTSELASLPDFWISVAPSNSVTLPVTSTESPTATVGVELVKT